MTSSTKPWTTIAAGVGTHAYTANWGLDFAALQESATNYVSVRGRDAAGNLTAINDVFFVLKDVTIPTVADNQAGDAAWRNAAGTL